MNALVISDTEKLWYEHTCLFQKGYAHVHFNTDAYGHSRGMGDCFVVPFSALDFCRQLYLTLGFTYFGVYADDGSYWQWYQ